MSSYSPFQRLQNLPLPFYNQTNQTLNERGHSMLFGMLLNLVLLVLIVWGIFAVIKRS
ncbi:MAG: hypothetical protein LLH30_05105 [Candidatus Manganitrophus sp. SA1]|nr:hypothetical protein [Candidatus Manganitrophus morganii]